tara:strand:- start:1087 stop:1578 length:492 start_codon:yes stop_codon:yes gene_type:complete
MSEEESNESCNVCYIKLEVSNSIITPCNHYFCSKCFFRWLLINNTCPMCRAKLTNRDVESYEIRKYSSDLLNLLIKGEEISITTMELIDDLKKKEKEKEKIEKEIENLNKKETEKLKLLSIISNKTNYYNEIQRKLNKKIRLLKIKKINMKNKKLKTSGSLHI